MSLAWYFFCNRIDYIELHFVEKYAYTSRLYLFTLRQLCLCKPKKGSLPQASKIFRNKKKLDSSLSFRSDVVHRNIILGHKTALKKLEKRDKIHLSLHLLLHKVIFLKFCL